MRTVKYPTGPKMRDFANLAASAFVLAIGIPAVAQDSITPDQREAIDALFESWDTDVAPGCIAGVVRDGAVVYSGTFGLADLEHRVAITENTRFNIASTSKQFTASGIVRLHLLGQLSLQDPLIQHIPELGIKYEEIRLEHLLHQTSGIQDYTTLVWVKGDSEDKPYTLADVMTWLAGIQAGTPPGAEYRYSNTNFVLLAEVIRRVTGKPLNEAMTDLVWGPAGMQETGFHVQADAIIPNRAEGHTQIGEGRYAIRRGSDSIVGDGDLYISSIDFARWSMALQDPAALGGEAFTRLMTTSGLLRNGEPADYAAGLMNVRYRGLDFVQHAGGNGVYAANFVHLPEQNLTVYIATNTPRGPHLKIYRILDILIPDELAARPTGAQFGDLAPDAALIEKVTGKYWSVESETTRGIEAVEREGKTQLAYVRGPGSQSMLVPQADGSFLMESTSFLLAVSFDSETDGQFSKMHVSVNGNTPETFSRYTPWKPDSSDLSKYAGSYETGEGLDATYRIFETDEGISFSVGEYTRAMTPLFEHAFTSSFGILWFEIDDLGKPVDLYVFAAMERVKNLRLERVALNR